MFQNDPYNPALRTEDQVTLKTWGIKRSRVDDNYRCLWQHHDQKTICLRMILNHHDADALDHNLTWIDPDFVEVIQPQDMDDQPESLKTSKIKKYTERGNRIFENLDPIVFRLFGFSDDIIDKVKQITKIEQIESLPLNDRNHEMLLDIYTRGFDPSMMITFDQILYRANADQLDIIARGN